MNRSKEDALTEIDWDVHYYGDSARDRVGNIMDQYAKSMSIAFDQWKHDNKWVQYVGFDTPTFCKGGKPEPGVQFYFSSAELYPLFIQSQKK